MTDVEILEMTFFDTCTIKRRVKQKNPKTGVTENVESIIAENIKCALSKKESVGALINGEIGSIVSTNKLFINPKIDIQMGDSIHVTNGEGSESIYLASKPCFYQSHKEIQITEKVRS